jgi:hypothetical protein
VRVVLMMMLPQVARMMRMTRRKIVCSDTTSKEREKKC